jgi:hypothetical protein
MCVCVCVSTNTSDLDGTNYMQYLHLDCSVKAYCGIGCIAPRILELGTRLRWVVGFTPGRLTPREGAPGTHWIRGWVGPRSGLDAVMKRKFPSPCRDSNPPIIQFIVQRCTTELSGSLDCKVILKWIFNRYDVKMWTGSVSEWSLLAGSCEHKNKHSNSIKRRGVSGPAGWMSASQRELCSIESVRQ